ncbi:Protein fat-free homolog [Rhizoctonia solani AG-1 IB]|uniref:Vacuolar protein sorting-associated protein 51 homolog n=1 Tax=Thanatephorus cucumeris (strain AG1-IB / isolate 7/3/14) TaxID=1108050 RepID=M5C9Q9_THACB|nr:Protein fat-free homolog [Rhizoctonia solani AG-1 IB]
MARGQPTTPVVITVPRHASALASGDLLTEIKQLAESEGKHFANDHGGSRQGARSKAATQASEWNSLLISARASRGPQWDVGLQQYLVDKDSNLYYDPTPLTTVESGSPTGEGQDGMDLTMGGQNAGNSESGTPITPRTGEDGTPPSTPSIRSPIPSTPNTARPPSKLGATPPLTANSSAPVSPTPQHAQYLTTSDLASPLSPLPPGETPPVSPGVSRSGRGGRARDLLRKHYGLGVVAATGNLRSKDPMDLDSSNFDAKAYYEHLITTATLPELLKKENELVQEIKQLDGERQSLVYNHHHELIAASDTIHAMKTRAESLDADLDKLMTAFSEISRLSAEVSVEPHEN